MRSAKLAELIYQSITSKVTALAATFFLRQFVPTAVIAACVLLAPTPGAAAGRPPLPDRDILALTGAEIAELEGLLHADWQSSFETKLGVGWDSNLLLSDLAKAESGFSRISVEGMLWRPAREQQPVELIGFLSANYRRMFSSRELPDDAEAFFQGEARWRPIPPVRLALLAQGYFLDTVLDLSTESERLSTPLRTAGFNLSAVARWEINPHWWTEATGTVTRSDFRLIPEDYREHQEGVRAGWQAIDGKFKLGLGMRQRNRHYDARNYTTPGGRPIAGTLLRYRAPEIEATAEKTLDWHGTWKIAGAFSQSKNADNGSGYFDYRLSKLLATVGWTRAPWDVQCTIGTSRYHWAEQVAGIGLDPPRRRRLDQSYTLQVTRQINDHWFAFFEAERECVSSNDPSTGYNLTQFTTGLGWKL